MQKPLIGITSYWTENNDHLYMPKAYIRAVRAAGGIPILISPGLLEVGELLNLIQGVIFTGGSDVNPDLYRAPSKHPALEKINHERDNAEWELAEAVLKKRLPIFAICRGAQLINVLQGGSLHQHLPDVYGETILHRGENCKPVTHQVQLHSPSILSNAYQCEAFEVHSWYHQSIDQLGQNLRVVGSCGDGVIEAYDMPDYSWLLGVQWHPELSAASDPLQQTLFDLFVKASSNYA
ncbi:MAG: gamma-glutamyl-gamma-aminobutyrate hydrolase family protein [Legionellales bacterium]|nr:gamma-glutamyl-gamma-aminobutyrate hydrolase family protein [Legionellales bacterium]